MVTLHLPSLKLANLQTKLSPIELPCNRRRSLSVSSKCSPPSMPISNSQQLPYPMPTVQMINQSVAAIIFGDGMEKRLYPLTKRRSEGAIPIAANYRLIDVVVSNCINSNIHKIYALTQFNSTSLNSHLSRAYTGVGHGNKGFVEVIAAYQSLENKSWFQGSADAMRRCLWWVLEQYPVTEFLILPGHHLYRMDYQRLIEAHRSRKSDITISTLNHIVNPDPGLGVLEVNSLNEVVDFEKPPKRVSPAQSSKKMKDAANSRLSSMGIYLVNKDKLTKLLFEYFPEKNDFAEVIRGALSTGMKVQTYAFDGYWEDMSSVAAFYKANMECTKRSNMRYDFYDRDCPLYTMPRYLPPTDIGDAVITDSVIGDGCIFKSCKIKGTVVGMRTRIGDGALIEDSVIMGSDIYQKEYGLNSGMGGRGMEIPIGIGDDTQIKRAIIDKNARIGRNVMIINKDNVQDGNRETDGYIISAGIVVVIENAVIPDGSIL